jgi:hypothetical protein
MRYEVVFDIRDAGFRCWWFLVPGVVLVLVGCCLLYLRDRLPLRAPEWRRQAVPPVGFLGFAVIWIGAAFHFTYGEYVRLSRVLDAGAASVVEGRVEDFHPMPYTGHQDESFVVAGRRFQYSDFEPTCAFNTGRSHGGPIEQGLQVRLWYVGDRIVRMAVAR